MRYLVLNNIIFGDLMEKYNDGQLYVTLFLLQQSKNLAEISRHIQQVCGQGASPTRTIFKWITQFKEVKTSKQDRPQSGRRSTCSTPKKNSV